MPRRADRYPRLTLSISALLLAGAIVAPFAGCGKAEAPDRSRTRPGPGTGAREAARIRGPVLFVSPRGRPAASGTRGDPFRSPGDALLAARGGETIVLLPGAYPGLRDDDGSRGARVRITSAEPDAPATIAGAQIVGGRGLRLDHLGFTAAVTVTKHPTRGTAASAADVVFSAVDFTDPEDTSCLAVGDAVRQVEVIDSRFHDCYIGLGGPGSWAPSTNIRVAGNLFEGMRMDAIAFGHWSNVAIADNTIRRMGVPGGTDHTDGVQFYGDSSHVRVARNSISGSANGQGILIQEAVGPIDDVDVESNLIHDVSAIAVQQQGAHHVRLVNNTIWDAALGALLLRAGPRGPVFDTVVANNILSSYTEIEGSRAGTFAGNVVLETRVTGKPPVKGQKPRFVDPTGGDFELAPGSPAIDRADPRLAPRTDLAGHERRGPPDAGALESGR